MRMKCGQLAAAGSMCRPRGGEKHRLLLQPGQAKTRPGQHPPTLGTGTHPDGHKAGLQTWYPGALGGPGMDTEDARKRTKPRAGFPFLFSYSFIMWVILHMELKYL